MTITDQRPDTDASSDSASYPCPSLPLAGSRDRSSALRLERLTGRLPGSIWQAIKRRAASVSPELIGEDVVMAAFAEVLAVWGGSPQFTLYRNAEPGLTPLQFDLTSNTPFAERAAVAARQFHAKCQDGTLRTSAHPVAADETPVAFLVSPDGGEMPSDASLTLRVGAQVEELEYEWSCPAGLFPAGMSRAMLGACLRLLHRLSESAEEWQKGPAETRVTLFPPDQAARRGQMNGVTAPIPDVLLQDLFAAQVQRAPERTALLSTSRNFTYEELFRLSNRWGRLLRDAGARPNTLVAVVMEKGWEQVVAALGILQSGAAYLPIDAAVPAERLHYLLENSGAQIALTQQPLVDRLAWPEGVARFVVTDDAAVCEFADTPLPGAQTPEDLAYVIYTSGSTGTPKGVMITHRGTVNSVHQTNEVYGITEEDRVLALTALHHDMSVYDIFGMLAAGGALVMPDARGVRDPAHWSERMLQEGVTVWNSVPAMMDMMLEYAARREGTMPAGLRWAFLGGDWIPITVPDRLRAQVPDACVVSVGGPTETTLWNIWYPVRAMDPAWKSIPYGKPIANTQYFVLDPDLNDCPDWVGGELCCVGVGVAKGYWCDEERTRQKFVRHPRTGERLYRTGDRGRFLPDGTIEFLGRVDFQIKIQGYRIEPGEIEAALLQRPDVRAVAVTAVGENGSNKRLAAYIVPDAGTAPDVPGLRTYLRGKLPPHMVPADFVFVEALPLTANGKVDRRALPAIAEVRARPETLETPFAAPAPGLETDISRIWEGVLKVAPVGVLDNVFALGAQSLHVVQAHSQVCQIAPVEPDITWFFEYPTVRALVKHIQSRAGSANSAAATPGAQSAIKPGFGARERMEQQRQAMARFRQAKRG